MECLEFSNMGEFGAWNSDELNDAPPSQFTYCASVMAIGETVLGAVLGVVLDRLASREVINFLRRSKIDQSLIDELQRVMWTAEKLLLDAEEKQRTKPPVKKWLDELQHWFYRAEEVMDEIATEARQSSLKSSHGTPSRRTKVRNLVPSLWSSFLFERRITRDISEIVSALERMLAHNDVLGLRELSGGGAPLRDSRATTSVPEDPKYKLRSKLGKKKFLLVLDDIWNENYHRWQTLRAPLLAGTNGSKIIVITRNAKVANIMRASCPVFSLKPLSDDDGWSLFSRHAFGGANLRHDPRLENIGRKIVQKCGRLPLAIKALGGLLPRRVFGNLLARPTPETPSKFARHFSYTGGHCDGITKFQAIKGNKYLRSVLKLGTSWGYVCCLTDEVPSIIKPSFSCLRVLSLSGYRNLRLPELVECPKQLRYLDVSGSEIKQLPKWVSTLCNLQTLILSNCTKLERLPVDMWRLVSLRHLDIRGARLVSHMPTRMGKLKDLKTLTDFVVGKDIGSHIQELSELKEIRGKFAIRQLQNVANPSDAGAVNLRNRRFIDDLQLEFDYEVVYEECIELLESLKPCLDVKSLTIRGYGGAILPKWLGVGCAEYKEIKFLCLSYCRYCSSLPPLGQLPSLKELTIEGMDGIQQVGHEFYGHNRCGLFPNLEILSFRDMKGWLLWSNVDAEGGAVCFPHLKKLFLTDCPNLKGNLHVHTPSLVKLEITGCVLLRRLLPTVPSAHVSVLQLETCPFLPAELPKAVVVTSITFLSLKGLVSLVKLPRELVMLSSLSNLSIADCDNLKSLADVQLPSSLKSLEISRCDAVESLPEGMESLPRFQNLKVDRCQHLLWFAGSSLPTSLRSLTVSECDRWEFPISMERMQHYTCLEHLDLRHTSKHLVSFPLGIFPNLRYLWFDNCEGLEKVYIPEGIEADNLVSLSELCILQCHALEMVGKETGRGEATTEFSAPNLAEFLIHGCEKVKPVDIEKEGEVLLPELRLLQITNSAAGELPHGVRRSLLKFSCLEFLSMDGLEVECFPVTGESLPTSLTWLIIKNFRKLRKLDGEALHRLKYLTVLYIWDCPGLERLPEKGLLPLSLDVLVIHGCPQLEKRCKPQKGKDWSKIHHIPSVECRE
ncbi:hypothetical protein Cgig2_011924 [Carnegiea gigantea]|uniref:Uncharacterized protein n=1 Tax=Carnegiea gigantea TaxID=171969 RepID=A0A9Q1GZY8_9CARY|nr:hypothetical protein Cgig2_011924 [Carnegiea gigantea]